jgi:hypothetical protein
MDIGELIIEDCYFGVGQAAVNALWEARKEMRYGNAQT